MTDRPNRVVDVKGWGPVTWRYRGHGAWMSDIGQEIQELNTGSFLLRHTGEEFASLEEALEAAS